MNVKGYYYDAGQLFSGGTPTSFAFPTEMVELQDRYIYQMYFLLSIFFVTPYNTRGPQGDFIGEGSTEAGGLTFTLMGNDNKVLFDNQPYLSATSIKPSSILRFRKTSSPNFFPINGIVDWRRSFFRKVSRGPRPQNVFAIGIVIFYE